MEVDSLVDLTDLVPIMSGEHADFVGQPTLRARCTVCLHPMPLSRDGAIHIHGPVGHLMRWIRRATQPRGLGIVADAGI